MNSLVEKFGVVETEMFVLTLIREPFEYTKCQNEHFDNSTLDELNKAAAEYCKNNPI